MKLYKIIQSNDGTVIDERLTYDEAMLYSGDSEVLVLAQDANVQKALGLIAQIASQA
jgi:hypothetical protein